MKKTKALCLVLLVSTIFVSTANSLIAAGPADPMKVGDRVPDFELPVQGQDNYLKLSKLIDDGPVVVVVLRGFPGYECAMCSRQVSSFRNRVRALASALGDKPNRVVLVYPGDDKRLDQRADRFLGGRKLPDPLVMVRDPGMEMVTEWGLRWNARRETAYPATFVVGPGNRIKWAKISRSHSGRATVEEILRAIKDL